MKKLCHSEPPIKGRTKLTYQWIPENTDTLLDAGCAYGLTTAIFAKEAKNVYGLDANPKFIDSAKEKYPELNFVVGQVENTPFADNFFDVIIMNEVLCYSENELQVLNEMFRILKVEGTLIISVPHKGLFSFMDTENYVYFLKKYLPWLYRPLYRLHTGRCNKSADLNHPKHRHYSQGDLWQLLENSAFKDHYKIKEIFRSALVWGVLYHNLSMFFNLIFREKITNFLLKPLGWLADFNYWVPYGSWSYNIAIRIVKK